VKTRAMVPILLPLVAGVACFTSPCFSLDVAGKVVDINDRPVTNVQVILDKGKNGEGGNVIAVFTDESGKFNFTDLPVVANTAATKLFTRALGYEQVSSDNREGSGFSLGSKAEDLKRVLIILRPVRNLAAVAPASAFLKMFPFSEDKQLAVGQCANCHQFPSPKIRRDAEMVNDAGAAFGKTDGYEVRYRGWHALGEFMGSKDESLLPFKSQTQTFHLSWERIQEGPFTQPAKLHDIADYLAKNLTGRLDAVYDYDYGAPIIANAKTTIREYAVAANRGVVREATTYPGSPYIWAVNVHEDKVIRIDPRSGAQKIFPCPYDKPLGLHTIDFDRAGNLWIGTTMNSTLARFTPSTEQWRFWSLNKNDPGVPKVPHDIVIDEDGRVKFDKDGKLWMSIISANSIMSVDLESGTTADYKLPGTVDSRVYGVVGSKDGKCIWYAQLQGDVGCFNTETHQVESVVPMKRWENPRRLAITENDILYIPLFGGGQIVKYDAVNRKKIATYDLPDRSSAPYAAIWDKKRQVLWVATSNADVIYRFDPKTEQFGVLPLPRQNAFLRMIALDAVTDDLLTAYASYDHMFLDNPPRYVVSVHPGD
jgi:virginiamycin B lyase